MKRSPFIRRKKGGSWKATRPDPLRTRWSEVVRTRDLWTCQKCGARKEFGAQIQGAHILSVSVYPQLKYLVENGIALCPRDHDWYDTHRGSNHDGEAETWVKGVIGIDGYTRLLVLAKTFSRPSKTMTAIALREELKRLEEAQG